MEINNEKFFIDCSDKEKEAISIFKENPRTIDESIKKLLKEINNRRLNNEVGIIKDTLKVSEIKTLICFVSLAKPEDYETSVLDKTLKVFTNLEKIYLICTKESKQEAEKISLKSPLKYKIIKVDTGDYDSVYKKLLELIDKDYDIYSKSAYFIDNTQGQKMISGVFYRFAVEQGIKIGNWQNEQVEFEKRQYRVPGTDNYYIVEQPEFANKRIYDKYDELIGQYKFDDAATLLYAINNTNEAKAIELLGKIFNYETLQKESLITTTLKKSDYNLIIKNIKDQKLKKEIRKAFDILYILYSPKSDIDAKDIKENTGLDKLNSIDFIDFETSQYEEIKLNMKTKKEVNKFLLIMYLNHKFKNEPEILTSIYLNIFFDGNYDAFDELSSITDKEFYDSKDVRDFFDLPDSLWLFLIDFIKFHESLKKELYNKMSFDNGVLNIPSLNYILDFNSINKIKKYSYSSSRTYKIFRALISEPDLNITENQLLDMISSEVEDDTVPLDEQGQYEYVNVLFNRLKKDISELNDLLKNDILNKTGKNIDYFIKVIQKKESINGKASIEINKNI